MPITALIFDLDETLVEDQRATRESLAAAVGGLRDRRDADPEALARAVWDAAQRRWLASPFAAYTDNIGMSSWEGLWARYDGDDPNVRGMREWAPAYRRGAWRDALAAHSFPADDELADTLQAAFERDRRARHILFADALPALERLKLRYRLALLTNGESDLQREKVAGARLGDYFDVVVASGDIAAGKPKPRIYAHTLGLLGVAAGEAAMIGDSLRNDVWGPQRVGIRGIWLQRDGRGPAARDADVRPDALIATLDEVEGAL
jgi:putative hydrolase of the HAD superfamily